MTEYIFAAAAIWPSNDRRVPNIGYCKAKLGRNHYKRAVRHLSTMPPSH